MLNPIAPFLVSSVGWMITRFQPRSHGGSSYKLIFGREYSGEIAEMGEQLWYRLEARVLAGRGKWEARFARGIWVGKSEIDDTHLVVDLERGIQKVKTVRRMPEEFRWNVEMLQNIRFTPWKVEGVNRLAAGLLPRVTRTPCVALSAVNSEDPT